MISIYSWNDNQRHGQWLKPEELAEHAEDLRTFPGVVWVDLENPTVEEEAAVYQQFLPVHTLTLEDVNRPRREPDEPHFPKVEEFPDYLFVIVNPLAKHVLDAVRSKSDHRLTNGNPTTQLSAVLTNHVLITHHTEPLQPIQHLRSFLNKHEAHACRGPDYLFHIVLDNMVDQYAPLLDFIDMTLDDLEMTVFGKPTQTLLVRLLQLKRDIILLRKAVIYEREVLARLCRGEFALIDDREMVYYRNVYDHLVRFTELIESSREMVSDLMQTHLSASSNKLNETMKFLTIISAAILPMSLVAGIYGMNFTNMPEIDWRFGYPFALGLMVVVGAGTLWFFKQQRWL